MNDDRIHFDADPDAIHELRAEQIAAAEETEKRAAECRAAGLHDGGPVTAPHNCRCATPSTASASTPSAADLARQREADARARGEAIPPRIANAADASAFRSALSEAICEADKRRLNAGGEPRAYAVALHVEPQTHIVEKVEINGTVYARDTGATVRLVEMPSATAVTTANGRVEIWIDEEPWRARIDGVWYTAPVPRTWRDRAGEIWSIAALAMIAIEGVRFVNWLLS